MQQRVLIIDHSPSASGLVESLSVESSFACEKTGWDTFVPERMDLGRINLLIAVAVPMVPSAMALLDWLQSNKTSIPMLAVFPSETDSAILEAVSKVADDFMFWPLHRMELLQRIWRLLGLDRRATASTVERLTLEMGMNQLVGFDEAFTRIAEKIPLVARTEAPVLITGETGTGKEMCARAIHYLSERRPYPFIPMDCGALPDHLFENEVFGHVRGAYTDARDDQKGLAAMAEKGTLFLDEVDSLSLPAQAKLLRFLQEKTYRPLGSASFRQADVNVIAATNRNLESCVASKEFRADLFFRLNVIRLDLPPLRERRRDIAPLADHFLRNLRQPPGRKSLSAAALRKLSAHDWPGNVRELFNVLHRGALFAEGATILPSHIILGEESKGISSRHGSFRQERTNAIAKFEMVYVADLLNKHGGNVTHAAIEAGQDRRAFGRLVKKYGIARAEA